MAERVEGLLIQQITSIAAIQRVIVNYKKLPKAQVTLAKSTKAEDQKSISYFKDNTFLEAEDAYFEAADFLSEAIAQLHVGGKTSSEPSPIGPRDSRQETTPEVNCAFAEDIDSSLRRFWELEEVPSKPRLSEENERCERHFRDTHARSPQGRYIVRLPFKSEPPFNLEGSRKIASRFYAKLEQRLFKQPDLESQYHDFLSEYLSMGHMERVEEEQALNLSAIYILHHPVVRLSSSTTKLRVVFNASAKTPSGNSLNDHLMIGPKLQRDLAAIILRWRLFRYVYTADITKMFRQILINPADADYQRILWRSHRDQPIFSYRLLTVTYGLASAPYLAIKVLDQLALDEGSNFPAAIPVLQDSIYVDDAIFGADEIHTLRDIRNQLVDLMRRGDFQLRKWAANAAELLENIPIEEHESASDRPLGEDESLK
ncbi:uncharacterized protein LOC123989166, partial [Osmia bicornis bicornis]|uniref:uncharacterized protein LOC123989166 n=1 Tax=Osmia bicornis bicornis TaxID=1437191 RepID=UPI001EAE8E0D